MDREGGGRTDLSHTDGTCMRNSAVAASGRPQPAASWSSLARTSPAVSVSRSGTARLQQGRGTCKVLLWK